MWLFCDYFDNFTLLSYKLQCITHKEQWQLQEENPGHLINSNRKRCTKFARTSCLKLAHCSSITVPMRLWSWDYEAVTTPETTENGVMKLITDWCSPIKFPASIMSRMLSSVAFCYNTVIYSMVKLYVKNYWFCLTVLMTLSNWDSNKMPRYCRDHRAMRSKFRYLSNFTMASRGFHCDSNTFELNKSRQNNRVKYIYSLPLNSYLFDSHCPRYKHQATVQNAEIVGYIVRPLCTGRPIAPFHCKTNRTVKCSAFLSSFGTKISRVSSFGPFPNRPMSSQSYRPKYSSVIHLYVMW